MFSVGDEVVCVNDEDDWIENLGVKSFYPIPFRKGDVFTVKGVVPSGSENGGYIVTRDCIQIGISSPSQEVMARKSSLPMQSTDVWGAHRFRKVERKRTREELYALIGIDGMVGDRVREVALAYPAPRVLPMCRCALPSSWDGV